MTGMTQLGYLGVGVTDAAAWDEFMTGVLGLQSNGVTEKGTALYRMDSLRARVHLQPSGEDDVIFLGWFVRNARELDEIESALLAAGLEVERGTEEDLAERGTLGLIRTRDPLGLINEVAYGPVNLYDQPFLPGRPFDGRFVAGELGFGHVVLIGGDPDANMHFYRDLLGLTITDVVAPAGRMPAAFLRTNGRHHSVAFPLKHIPEGGKRIQHFMVQPEELDDVGRGQDIAETRGELEVRLGRHGNDRTVSCYIRSPSGFGIEYGWGALEVKSDAPMIQHSRGDAWGHQVANREGDFSGQFGKDGNHI